MENEVGMAGEWTPRFGLAVEFAAAAADEVALLEARVASYSGLSSVPTRTAIKWGGGENGSAEMGRDRLAGRTYPGSSSSWTSAVLQHGARAACVSSEVDIAGRRSPVC